MPTATLTCPHCSQILTTAKGYQAGSRFRCPACGSAFTAEGPRARPSRAPADGPEDRRGAGGWLVLAAVVGVGLLLLAGAGAALALHFLWPRGPSPAAGAPSSAGPNAAGQAAGAGEPQSPQPMDLSPGAPPTGLPAERQEEVNAAIDRGVAFLEKQQSPGGTWGFGDQVGLAALPGLTLLECGVPADDSHVRKAAEFVRGGAVHLQGPHMTYELSLGLLFLDRLHDPADEPLIRTLALRLLAGQKASGGWTYDCPDLSDDDEKRLGQILEATRPHAPGDLTATRIAGGHFLDGLFTGRTAERPAGGAVGMLSPGPTEEEKQQARRTHDGLSPQLRAIPALTPPAADDRPPGPDGTDNSNTQFATLALWAAGRHGVPTERALARLGRRFQVSQAPDGQWDYNYFPHPGGGGRPAMTAAGLLGLAVGHGVTVDLKGKEAQEAEEDPQVEKGMRRLGGFYGEWPPPQGLYFLWSVERVGMLYGRKTIGGKEWYPIGVDYLLKQQQNGHWQVGGYFESDQMTPITDACFALLFLKRANLAQDLTSKVQFLTKVHDK